MSMFARADSFLDSLRKHILNILAIVASVFVVALIIKDMYSGGFEVEIIEVAPGPTVGIAGSGASEVLLDGIGREWHKAVADSPINVIIKESDEPAIAIGGTNLPLRYVAKLIRRFFGHPIVELSGQMLLATPLPPIAGAISTPSVPGSTQVRLLLRNSEALTNPYFDHSGTLDQVMEAAALASLEQIDAYAAVIAGSQGTRAQQERALRLAKVTLASEAKKVSHGRGYLAEATARYKLRDLDGAETFFNRAASAFSGDAPDDKQFAVAEDGLAIIYTNKREWKKAEDALTFSLSKWKNYDSALYHQVELNDYESRSFFGENEDSSGFCTAEAAFQTADRKYDEFIGDHPGFAVAITQMATMHVLHLRWRRMTQLEVKVCPGLSNPGALDAEVASTMKLLQDAVEQDADNPYGWYESAALYYELQDSQYRLSETEPAARLALVKEAVSRFKKTTDIEDGNWYFWYRYGEALLTVATLDPAEREAKNVEARTAYCRSIATNKSDPGYIVAAQMNLRKIGLECKTN